MGLGDRLKDLKEKAEETASLQPCRPCAGGIS
jgi:hypothetical protein